ncbi:hypothetical protein BSZ36_16880 [Rubricoccus marinus]|uniref:Peptidyl-prolyl cis-trans isomerase n=1 Tax=Rubricoccus marinus TaxID=716817 RepID=A0A259U447_9BACT|nr:hypothetical protein BSZ36_16880 [Rubricoccus marinus]
MAGCDSSEDGVADANSTVTVAYEGRLTNGTIFDSSPNATFSLRQVIPGFRDGIIGMEVGESKTITVAPEDGYGASPPPGSGIPRNATLIFDVTLLAIR